MPDAELNTLKVGAMFGEVPLLENYVDGPFHPTFRYLVDSLIAPEQMIKMILGLKQVPLSVTFRVPARRVSIYLGYKRKNLSVIKNIFGLDPINLQQDTTEDHLELVA